MTISLGHRSGRSGRQIGMALAVAGAALAVASVTAWLLEAASFGIHDASPVYLVPVVIIATRYGARAGTATAVAAFLIYDLVFTEPRFSLVVADPAEWVELLLLLFVALVVGRLSALGTERAALAERRASEAIAQFTVSRQLATEDLEDAIPAIVRRIAADAGLSRVWVTVEDTATNRPLADSFPGEPLPGTGTVDVLVRTPGDEPARWVRAHAPVDGPRPPAGATRLRVRIEVGSETLGSLWAIIAAGAPNPETTRLLSMTADQLGLALHRERLRRAATDAEVARRSDALKSRLLTSVSHDLRTPLAGIRAAAGGLLDPAVQVDESAARRAGAEIDAAAERLDILVRGLLDLGRIESGLLQPELEAFDLRSVVESAVDRAGSILGARQVEVDVPEDAPPVRVDGLLLDEILANLLENIARHAPPPARCRIRSTVATDGFVDLVVEDGGPGVAAANLGRLLSPFAREDRGRRDRGEGSGIGLAVVQGFAAAMGVEVSADRSPLGGLAVTLRLPIEDLPPTEVVA
jgi:two-component system sensor histidine kinase KdpD